MQKRKMMFLMVALLALGFWWLQPGTVLAQQPADKYAPAPVTIKGWTPYAEPVKDLTAPDKRHPQYPWVLKDPFPWKPSWPRKDVPYTGEELLWFRECAFWGAEGGKTQDYFGYLPTINKRGLVISKNFYIMRTHSWERFDEVIHYRQGISSIYQKAFTILDNPPEIRGLAQLVVKYDNAPGKWKDPDRYSWVPALRRVRRSAGGDRQDDTLGFPASNDDNGERQFWEYTYEIIAEDVLYEVNGIKGHDILGDPKVIVDNPVYPGQGVWGDSQNPYREDGGIECWVVKAIPKDPNYYLGYILYWIEKHTKLQLHEEQYDHEGNYVRIGLGEQTWKPYPNSYNGRTAWGRTTIAIGDWQRDYRGYGWYGGFKFGQPIPDTKYTMTELSKEYFWRSAPGYRAVTKAEQFPPYVPLYEEKTHKDRAGVARLDPEMKAKVTRYQDMWKARGGFDAWGWANGTKFQELK
ncbi:MAG: hypothetical protein A3G93_09700 [Nitrospinae bacterium RIFCSPLOWO2_12_FULL_45_22]|nr:MAG: hypothetical protein A3G93_09700 [Nitrospinae bacterium RIFCSPLOWO2_12_FULL_45_22]